MKTPGKDRKKAYEQAKEYAENLPPKDLPFCILISDFLNFDYYDLDNDGKQETFKLEELPQKVELFGFLAGYKDVVFEAVNPVDIEAAEHMGELHDALKENGYTGHELEMYLVRLLFCLFADDSGIFDEKKLFFKYINDRTNIDGSDLAMHIGQIFDTLNKPTEDVKCGVRRQCYMLHYSMDLFTLAMREFLITDMKTGEKLRNFKKVGKNDIVMGDRIYGTIPGIAYLKQHKAGICAADKELWV